MGATRGLQEAQGPAAERQWTWGGGLWAMLASSIVMGLGVALGLVLALSLLAF